jgi:DNA helicase II / ATP-dependent DNA helicase PcrA
MTTILPHPDAPEGEVKTLSRYVPQDFVPGSLILCRNTAPLVAFAYGLLRRDIPCKILGRDIGAQLSSLVKKMRPINLQDLEEKLSKWRDREVEKCLRDDISPDRIYDQYECLCFFISSLDEDSRSVDSLLAKIELMFTDDTNGSSSSRVTLSTVHKAKGLEFPTVFLLDKEKYMPSRFAKQPWQIRQEYNLLYVAVTRAMEKLIYISSDSWKELE